MRGLFVTFEGVEGCGKSTQITLLGQYLRECGHQVVLTREPGGTPVAEAIRGVLLTCGDESPSPMTELLLYAAARAQHVSAKISPALESGAVVLCDRFCDSTTAYQGGGRRLPEDVICRLNEYASLGIKPDLTLLLDLPVEEGLRRSSRRGVLDRIEGESLEFHQRVRGAFLALAAGEPGRITIIDASGPVDAVAEAVRRRIDTLIAGRNQTT